MNSQNVSSTLNSVLGLESHLEEIVSAIRRNPTVLLEAAPGSGKTTLVPPALLDVLARSQKIILLQPRRVAAWSVARRLAETRGEQVGATIGYRVRGDTKVGPRTRIEVVTEGVFLRMIEHDPFLEGVGAVVFDEFHERSIDSDLALALCADVQQSVRPDLKILVMSATLGRLPIERVLPDHQRLSFDAHRFAVELEYVFCSEDSACGEGMAREIRRLFKETEGDILAFLPGVRDIERVQSMLQGTLGMAVPEVLPLYGDLPYEEQRRAITPAGNGRRRIILATPIAETSLTIENVSTVIDSGFGKVSTFDPGRGLPRLETERITKAQATQRMGRAGRTGPGRCVRLWPSEVQESLRTAPDPEILNGDLAPLALTLAGWGGGELRWVDQPPAGALQRGRELLVTLGAVMPDGRLSDVGRAILSYGTHPRLGRILYEGMRSRSAELAAILVALLEERDLYAKSGFGCDISPRVEAVQNFRSNRKAIGGVSRGRLERLNASIDRTLARLKVEKRGENKAFTTTGTSLGVLLGFGFPDRIAQRRSEGGFILASGRAAILPSADLLSSEPLIVAAALMDRHREAFVQLAAPIARVDLDRHLESLISKHRRVEWDGRSGGIVAAEETRLGSLVLESRKIERPPDEEVLQAVKTWVINRGGVAALPWDDGAREFQARVRWARSIHGEYPDLSDEALVADFDNLIGPHLFGVTRATQLSQLDMQSILRSFISFHLSRRLDDEFPEEMIFRGRFRRKISYVPGELPILEATVQDLLGIAETPRLGRGAVAVMLHILSPARRPIQVTKDLAAFWKNTYPDVRKELRGRYPKHRWPEDPFATE